MEYPYQVKKYCIFFYKIINALFIKINIQKKLKLINIISLLRHMFFSSLVDLYFILKFNDFSIKN